MDSKLKHDARALGLRICSHVFNSQHLFPDDPFPLPWTLCNQLMWGMSKREVYRCLRQLVDRGHLKHEGAKGCPNTAHFTIPVHMYPAKRDRFSSAKSGTTRVAKSGTTGSAKCDTTSGAKNVSPLISNVPSEQIIGSMEETPARSARDDKGEFNGSASPRRMSQEEIRQRWGAAKKKV